MTDTITIIGGGISGLCTAYTLTQAGLKVQVIHNNASPMNEASGNPCALLDARPVNDDTPHAIFNKLAFTYAYTFYDNLPVDVWSKRGLVKFPYNERETSRFNKMINGTKTIGSFDDEEIDFITQEQASHILNISTPCDGLYFKNGGAVYPHKIRDALSKGIKFINSSATAIKQLDNNSWCVKTTNGDIISNNVILATGHKINDLSPRTMPHTITRGQIATVASLKNSPALPCSMTGYVIPTEAGYVLGSTANRGDTDGEIRQDDFVQIADKNVILTNTPVLNNPIGRVGWRSNPSNRMPWSLSIKDGLYIVAGMGSRGFINAPLCANVIKCMIMGQQLPIEESIINATLYEHYGV